MNDFFSGAVESSNSVQDAASDHVDDVDSASSLLFESEREGFTSRAEYQALLDLFEHLGFIDSAENAQYMADFDSMDAGETGTDAGDGFISSGKLFG